MKKLIFTLSLLLSISSIYAIDFTVDGINYSTLNTSTVQVSGGIESKSITFPSEVIYNNVTYSVTSIGEFAFFNFKLIASITIPSSVTMIGNSAFRGCVGLSSMSIPSSVNFIGGSAFDNTAWLNNQANGLVYIGKVAYIYKGTMPSNTSISLIEGTISISSSAFQDCSGLSSIVIPSSVSSIGGFAFRGCSALIDVDANNQYYTSQDGLLYNKTKTTLIQCPISKTGNLPIPSSVNSIIDCCFQSCSGLTSITIPSSVISIGAYAFKYCWGLTSITIPLSVISIGNSAFDSCYGLTSINISNSVISIGPSAFQSCTGLTSITIPSSVESIQFYTFDGCSSLTSMTIPSSVTTIGDFAFSNCSGLTSISIPNTVTSIGKGAFYNCSGLTSITIPNSVTSIGDYAFQSCSKLASFIIPSSVTTIGNSVFCYCSGLTSMNIPNSVTTIGDHAFDGCSGITSIIIPSSVTKIGTLAFQSCYGLKSIYAYAPSPVDLSLSNVFYNISKTTCTLYVPIGSKALYQAAAQWKDFTNIVENTTVFQLSDNNINIGTDAITLPVNIITNIAWSASSNQSWLTVTPGYGTGSNTLSLNSQANQTTTSRTAIVTVSASGIPSQTIIVEQAWQQTVQLTAGGLFSTLTKGELNTITNLKLNGTIDARDFKTMRDNMPRLASLDLRNINIVAYAGTDGTASTGSTVYPANTIPDYSFCIYNQSDNSYKGKSTLISVVLPLSAIYIGTSAFDSCNGLTSITIPNSVIWIGDYAFFGCIGLTNMTIPSSVTSIWDYAFSGCTGLTNITIPSSVTTIWNYAFDGCNGLTSISIPNTVTWFGNSPFNNCKTLSTINVESGNLNYSGIDGVLFDKNKTTLIQYPNGKPVSSYIIPTSVTSIGASAFESCTGLTNLNIPSSITSIGTYAFSGCTGLNSIYSYANTPVNISSSLQVFYNVYNNGCVLYVPTGSKALYQAANQWKDFTNIVEFDATAVNIANSTTKITYNSTAGAIQIQGTDAPVQVSLFNMNGMLVKSGVVSNGESLLVQSLPKGIYVLKAVVNKEVVSQKVVI